MTGKTGTPARRAARAVTAGAVIAAGVFAASPAHAVLPLPTITGVAVVGGGTSKVVTAGSTIQITGTGFGGMTDNAAVAGCTTTAAADYPAAGSGCSQVRFLGIGATGTANFTVATRYIVASDTTIYATVPTIAAADGATGGPVAGTGSVKVQVLNTMPTATASLQSNSATSEVFYRKPLTATLAGATNANPVGGGTLPVTLAGGIATLTTTTLPQEKLSAYVYSTSAGSPQVATGAVSFKDGTSVNVTLPPGSPQGDPVGVMVVHDGIAGVPDATNLKYPAVINKLESCPSSVAVVNTLPLPVCTGGSTAPASGTADFKVTGKGFTGSTSWSFNGTGGTVTTGCTVMSDTLAYCHLVITTPPTSGVVSVTFVPLDPDSGGPLSAPVLVPTSGGIVIYGTLV
jgi:hypothetical protein